MAEQIRTTRTNSDTGAAEAAGRPVQATSADAADRLRDEIDDLLDEIDEVLETNSEEFVKNYVQKGGE